MSEVLSVANLRTVKFQVQPQQHRELSVNHSIITSNFSYRNSYEEILQYFKKYETINIPIEKLHQSQLLKLKKYKEAIYYGEFYQNKRGGLGLMVYNSGQTYQGNWVNDLRHGEGYQKFANGCVYKGSYQFGKLEGQGKYVWPNGQIYEGQWFNNMKHGTGMWKNDIGDTYFGEWKQGQASGFGVFTQAQGNRYQGTFNKFMKNGQGTQRFINGDLYKGNYVDGKFDGFGEYFWKDGSFYKGYFKSGVRNGHGIWKKGNQSGDKYEGNFQRNKKEGYGIYTWGCGHIYKGNYCNNMRHGYGEMYWQDGSFYKGNWENDKENGQGELFNGYQNLVKGIFKAGQLVQTEISEDPSNKLSQFYTIPNKVERYLETPISRATKSNNTSQSRQSRQSRQRQKVRQIPIYINTIQQAKPIKFNNKMKAINPLVQDTYFKKKVMQTLNLRQNNLHAYQIDHSRDLKSNVHPKSSVKERMPHSAFQIHRLHKNKKTNNAKAIESSINNTQDDNIRFAFRPNPPIQRQRYYSRIN